MAVDVEEGHDDGGDLHDHETGSEPRVYASVKSSVWGELDVPHSWRPPDIDVVEARSIEEGEPHGCSRQTERVFDQKQNEERSV